MLLLCVSSGSQPRGSFECGCVLAPIGAWQGGKRGLHPWNLQRFRDGRRV